ncbi:MAG: ABC transporter substrate-binding protein [bacterium]
MNKVILVCLLFLAGTLCIYNNNAIKITALPAKAVNTHAINYKPRSVRTIAVQNYNIIGNKYDYYAEMPKRVIAIGENINETLVALGVEDKVICAVNFGNKYYKPEPEYADGYNAIKFEKLKSLNTETVLALNPDLIIAGQSFFSEKGLKDTEFWNKRNIHTFLAFNANKPASHKHRETLELEYEFILGLGRIFDKEDKARKIVAQMNNTISKVCSEVAMGNKSKQKVMIIEQLGKQLVSYDDTKLAGDICTRLGAQVPSNPVGTISLEYLLQQDPDVLFVVKSGGDPEQAAEEIKKIPVLRNLQAVKNNRVHGIALNYTYNCAIKTGAGIKKLAKGIYPEIKKI